MPRTISTDNSSCFKSEELGDGERLERIRCTPNLHTGTVLKERTTLSIKSLTRADVEDGLTFDEGVHLAIGTLRQTPNNTLKMTTFQMHLGGKPRTAITNLIGQPSCQLFNWKQTLTKYILAQPTELLTFTTNYSDEELADYLVSNDSKKRAHLVSQEFKPFKFYEKKTELEIQI